MKWKKVFSSILVASMAAALVAGCGSGSQDESSASSADGENSTFPDRME